ncbi:MAG: DUF1351 domain-containing protein [Lachnospiraceae bacterium]
MQELNFEIKQDTGLITANFEDLEAALAGKMQELAEAKFTEESKKIAKAEVTELRKLKTAIDTRRKEVKKSFMQPYDDFEVKVKRLIALVDQPIEAINNQVQEFEAKRIAARQLDIKAIYDENIADMGEYIPLNRIYDKRWENATTTLKAIQKAICEFVTNTRRDVSTIGAMQSEATSEALQRYKQTLDLTSSITYINSYETQKRAILEREQERKLQEAREAGRREVAREAEIRQEVKEEIKQVDEVAAAPITTPESKSYVYTIKATPAEVEEFEMLLNSLGVYFERKDV